MTAAADGMWRFLTVCQTEAGRVSTEGSISGDFTTHYQVDAQIQGETGPAERLRVDANLRGDCPAGMKPGDVVMPNGAVHHAADIASANAAAPAP